MEFKGLELDFDIFDADTADAYEAAVKHAQAAASEKQEGESLGDTIRHQCQAVFDFFDDLFGDGFHKALFGERTNLMECIRTFRDFNDKVADQKASIDALMQEMAVDKQTATLPNRAARRAAARAVPS